MGYTKKWNWNDETYRPYFPEGLVRTSVRFISQQVKGTRKLRVSVSSSKKEQEIVQIFYIFPTVLVVSQLSFLKLVITSNLDFL